MQANNDLLQRGIAAFQAGNRSLAHTLLQQLVDQEPDNEQGWYYLAATESDPRVRKKQLERVLVLNPSHVKAREVLDRIKAREAELGGDPTSPQSNPDIYEVKRTGSDKAKDGKPPRIHSIDPAAGHRPGAADSAEGGFKLPFTIPGAPEYISLENVAKDGFALLRTGWNVLLRREGDYAAAVDQATWWSFVLLTLTASVFSAALSLLIALYIQILSSASLLSFFSILFTPLLAIPVTMSAFFAGCYASYRFAQTQGWNALFVRHAMTAAVVWGPSLVFSSVLTFVFSLLGVGGTFTGIFMMIFAAYIMGDGYERLYLINDANKKYAVPAITFLVMLVVIALLRTILGGLIVGGALPFALF